MSASNRHGRRRLVGNHVQTAREDGDITMTVDERELIAQGIIKHVDDPASVRATIQDSGDRHTFASGAVRDMHQGKGRCDLLPPSAILRLARHFEAGAKKYGDRNWEQGIPIESFIDSAIRHTMKYMLGWNDEDHLCAAAWNLMCALETEEKFGWKFGEER